MVAPGDPQGCAGTWRGQLGEEWVMQWTGLQVGEGHKTHLQANLCKAAAGVEGSIKAVEVDVPLCKT